MNDKKQDDLKSSYIAYCSCGHTSQNHAVWDCMCEKGHIVCHACETQCYECCKTFACNAGQVKTINGISLCRQCSDTD